MENKYISIKDMIANNRLDEALSELDYMILSHPEDSYVLFLRGKVKWRLGRRSEAQNDYLASAAIDPDGPASAALEYARDIESFFNPDLLNP